MLFAELLLSIVSSNSFELLGVLGGGKESVSEVSVSADNMMVVTSGNGKIVSCSDDKTLRF